MHKDIIKKGKKEMQDSKLAKKYRRRLEIGQAAEKCTRTSDCKVFLAALGDCTFTVDAEIVQSVRSTAEQAKGGPRAVRWSRRYGSGAGKELFQIRKHKLKRISFICTSRFIWISVFDYMATNT